MTTLNLKAVASAFAALALTVRAELDVRSMSTRCSRARAAANSSFVAAISALVR